MIKTLRGLLAVPAVALTVTLAAPAAGAATAARLASPAALNADGTVSVRVEYTCDANWVGHASVGLEQQKGQTYSEGVGRSGELDCTGTPQFADVVVTGYWGPFTNGRALARVSFYSWNPDPESEGYEEARDGGMIRIAK